MSESLLIIILVATVFVASASAIWILYKYIRLKRQHNFISEVFRAAPVSVFVLDQNKYIVDLVNTTDSIAMKKLVVSDIVGKQLSHFVEDKTSPLNQAFVLLNQSFDRIVATRQSEYFSFMINDSYMIAKTKLIKGDYVISVVSDVTDHMMQVNEMITKKQQEINVAFRAGGLVAWSYDVESRIFKSSRDNNVIGDRMSYDILINKIRHEDRETVNLAFQDIIDNGELHREFTVKVRNSQGKYKWSNVHAVPNGYDDKNRVIKITGSQKDITSEIETLDELVRLREAAEESDRMKSSFIANMSHEIRTPLNAIVGFSSLMITAENKEEAQAYHKIIEQNNTLLLNIVNDVLSLSKIESRLLTFNPVKIELYETLEYLSETTRHKLTDDVKLILDNEPSDLQIEADIDRLTQVLTNLLNNAYKFTNVGEIHLGFKLLDSGRKIKFYVTDTGIGISPENLSRIFDRFVKVNNFIQGTGLGLPICESIVKSMQGEIGVESTQGKGSTFWFILPTFY